MVVNGVLRTAEIKNQPKDRQCGAEKEPGWPGLSPKSNVTLEKGLNS